MRGTKLLPLIFTLIAATAFLTGCGSGLSKYLPGHRAASGVSASLSAEASASLKPAIESYLEAFFTGNQAAAKAGMSPNFLAEKPLSGTRTAIRHWSYSLDQRQGRYAAVTVRFRTAGDSLVRSLYLVMSPTSGKWLVDVPTALKGNYVAGKR